MSTDRIGLNPQIEGEIRRQSFTNILQNCQSVTNPFTFRSNKNPKIELDLRIDGFFVHPLERNVKIVQRGRESGYGFGAKQPLKSLAQ